MEIISIEKKTFEELVSRLGLFVKRMDSINRQRGGRRMSDWMDNQDVCQVLKISPRTLQTLRDSGRLPHSKINNRIYYRPEDVERLIAPCKTIATTVFCHTVNWEVKSSIVKAILNECCKVAIVASFDFIPYQV